jgi:hypothetical protein
MSRSHPNCDRHTNLQMVACWVKRPQGVTSAHICPVPGCGRYYVDETYLAARDVEIFSSERGDFQRADFICRYQRNFLSKFPMLS